MQQKKGRGQWVSNIGFLLATAGSAIGLGNLWKFPYMVGNNGGFLFILVSLVVVGLIGIPVMMSEMAIGRNGKRDPVGSFGAVNKKFAFVGYLGVGVAFLILSYYSVIGGWVLKYIVTYLSGGLRGVDTLDYFNAFIQSPWQPILWHMIFMGITVFVCYFGVNKGIERASKIMMPALFIIVLIIALRAVTLPGAGEGLKFLFQPSFDKIGDPNLYIGALSQSFYSLSLGMGIIITYGSYMNKKEDITKSSVIVSGMDLSMAILASIAIMPAVFSAGMQPTQGPALIFATLPHVFEQMPLGILFAVLFFVLVLFAALTSAISLLECAASFTIDELRWSRKKSVISIGVLLFVLGIPSSLSMGVWSGFTILGMNLFDFFSFLADNIILPISAFGICLFVGFAWTPDRAAWEITSGGRFKYRFLVVWKFLIKWIIPWAIVVVFVAGLVPVIAKIVG